MSDVQACVARPESQSGPTWQPSARKLKYVCNKKQKHNWVEFFLLEATIIVFLKLQIKIQINNDILY